MSFVYITKIKGKKKGYIVCSKSWSASNHARPLDSIGRPYFRAHASQLVFIYVYIGMYIYGTSCKLTCICMMCVEHYNNDINVKFSDNNFVGNHIWELGWLENINPWHFLIYAKLVSVWSEYRSEWSIIFSLKSRRAMPRSSQNLKKYL